MSNTVLNIIPIVTAVIGAGAGGALGWIKNDDLETKNRIARAITFAMPPAGVLYLATWWLLGQVIK